MRTSLPMAYLITTRTYGTWLHGDERGSHHRRRHAHRGPLVGPSQDWQSAEEILMRQAPVTLGTDARQVIEATVRQACDHRGWGLLAANARTNHLHVVVAAPREPEAVMHTIKAWTTRRLVERGLLLPGIKLWSRHGSTVYLWTWQARDRAIEYVVHGQDRKHLTAP